MTSADFEAVYDTHAPDVLRVASSVLSDRTRAEAVVHQVFLQLWRRPESYDPAGGELGAYLRDMARTCAIEAWRRTASAPRTQEHFQRETVALSFWGGLSASEIAHGWGVPLGTVKAGMRLALTRLRAETARAPISA